jgi:hypothetical protein
MTTINSLIERLNLMEQKIKTLEDEKKKLEENPSFSILLTDKEIIANNDNPEISIDCSSLNQDEYFNKTWKGFCHFEHTYGNHNYKKIRFILRGFIHNVGKSKFDNKKIYIKQYGHNYKNEHREYKHLEIPIIYKSPVDCFGRKCFRTIIMPWIEENPGDVWNYSLYFKSPDTDECKYNMVINSIYLVYG